KVAEAMGIWGKHVERSKDLPGAVEEFLAHDGPAVLDVVTERAELTIPPTISAEQVRGFSLYALRTVLSGKGSELVDLAKVNLRHILYPDATWRAFWKAFYVSNTHEDRHVSLRTHDDVEEHTGGCVHFSRSHPRCNSRSGVACRRTRRSPAQNGQRLRSDEAVGRGRRRGHSGVGH